MPISVVIPAHNAGAHLARCLEGLAGQTLRPAEVIVVDDGSTDDTGAIATAHGCRVVRLDRNVGPGGARNAGVRTATSDRIAFVDSDDVPDPGWLQALEHHFDAGAQLIAGGFSYPPASTIVERFAQRRFPGHDLDGRNGFLPAATTSNMAVLRSVFDEVGGFDTALRATEDTDFSFRAGLLGVEITAAPDATIRRHHRTDVRELLRQRSRNARASAQLFWKYQRFVYMGARRRGSPRRPWIGLVQAAVWSWIERWDRQDRALAHLDLAVHAAVRYGIRRGQLDLLVGATRPVRRLEPADARQAHTAMPLAGAPAFLVVADDPTATGVRLAMRPHRDLSVAPAVLDDFAVAAWDDERPWSWGLARMARQRGWPIRGELAARRLEGERPPSWGEAYLTLHAIHAWLQGRHGYGLVALPAAGRHLLSRLPKVPAVVVGDLAGAVDDRTAGLVRLPQGVDHVAVLEAVADVAGITLPARTVERRSAVSRLAKALR